MTIESLPANLAAPSATVAQTTAIQATDGAPIETDAQSAQIAAFAAIFQQLTAPAPAQTPAAQTAVPSAPTLPNLPPLPNIPPSPSPVDSAQPESADVTEDHSSPASPPNATPLLLSNLTAIDEPSAEPDPEHADPEEKPQKQPAANCDSANISPPIPPQALEIAKSAPSPTETESQAIIPECNGKRRPVQMEKPALPRPKDSDEPVLKETQPKKEVESQPLAIPKQLAEEPEPAAKEDSSTPARPKLDASKPEFTLPQPHLAQKELDPPAPAPPVPPEQAFIQSNHPKIITAIHGELLPDGGSMHIRLDPPELGALNVQIDVRDGIVNASFQTSNDEATRLLSHSLTQLRTTLESAGVSVEKLQVQQAPREHFTSNNNDRDRNPRQQAYEHSSQDDRQRREMLQRMWRRLTVGRDMLDLVA